MNELIERQAAIDALDFEIVHMTAYCDGKNEGNPLAQYNKGLEDGKKAIEALPSVQPEPQEGHWIWVAGELMCSECRTIYSDLYPDYDNSVACPHCGAKMKEENRMSGNCNDAENYCKDCDRSIYGKYPSCDTNIENNGIYTKPGSPCYCKCREGVGMVEKYPWEKRTNG